MQVVSSYHLSLQRSDRILSKERILHILLAYFGSDYVTHTFENDRAYQRRGVDLWVVTHRGIFGVDLKACSTPVDKAIHLEIYSVRENRTLGYLLRNDSLCDYLLYVNANGEWRMFRRDLLAQATRENFQTWLAASGVHKQETECGWRPEGSYSSSTLRVPTRWIRGAYYKVAGQQDTSSGTPN